MPNPAKRRHLPPIRRAIELPSDSWDLSPNWSRDLDDVQPSHRAVSRFRPPAAPVIGSPSSPRHPIRAALVRVLRRLLELIEGRS